ncbi:MAG: response regulator, partial [Lachnospiraceae bacterium]|nr:response regulator [Lachnospiraceae bacterium]
MKVLIVEDEVRIREGLIKLLEKIGNEYEVVGQANDGSEGLKLCKSLKPDLIITDVQMPNMDGLEMLKAIFSENINVKAIVLSAYSEFEYARTAMKLGVTEYLLKPINLSDFSQALESIRHQIAEDKKKKPDKVGTLDQILRDIMSGRLEPDENIYEYLEKNYSISPYQKFIILFDYLGNQYEECAKKEIKELEQSLSRYEGNSFCVVDLEYRKSLAVVIYKYQSAADFERWIQYQLLQQINDKAAMGYTVSEGLNELSVSIERLFPYMDWNISFEDDVLISYPKITQVQTLFCVYPQELETKMKAAVCASDFASEEELMKKFIDSFRDGKVYNPHEIKECYVRFIWAVL